MNFYKRHLGDIAKSCSDLSQGQMGAYDLLLDWHYANEKPIPLAADKVYRIGRAFTKAERDNVDSVLAELFIQTEDGYTHKRAAEEMAKASAQADTNRRIAEEREAKKRATKGARSVHEPFNETGTNNTTKRQPSQTPDSRQEQRSNALEQQAARKTAERFQDFWTAYPVKKGRAEAEAKWRAKGYDAIADTIIADVKQRITRDRQWLDGFAPHGSTYVNGKGWLDEIEAPRGSRTEQSATPDYLIGAQ